jgi:predicted metal-dependent phosphoesterase TrpH
MERRADLHCHSLYSDGTCRPTELVDLAVGLGHWGLSITDHDSIDAFDEAAPYAAAHSIVLFPGIEISSKFQEESIHVLGYCFDPKAPGLQEICCRHRAWREERNKLMIKKLAAAGMPITMDEVKKLSPDTTTYGRPHLALALLHHGYVSDVATAFRHFLGSGKSCYVEGEKSTVAEAIDIVHAAGGLAVLAHPHLIKNSSIVERVLRLPFDGLEAYYAFIGKRENLRWKEIADRRGLFATGGSDFHGMIKPEWRFGSSWAPESTLDLLYAHYFV